MTRFEALDIIVFEAMSSKRTKIGYSRVAKALMAIDINATERGQILYRLGYANEKGEPYAWLFKNRARD